MTEPLRTKKKPARAHTTMQLPATAKIMVDLEDIADAVLFLEMLANILRNHKRVTITVESRPEPEPESSP